MEKLFYVVYRDILYTQLQVKIHLSCHPAVSLVQNPDNLRIAEVNKIKNQSVIKQHILKSV